MKVSLRQADISVGELNQRQKQRNPIAKSKITRSRKGCFNCRKWKKKCDETKPRCSACVSRCIPCVWPDHEKQILPKDYITPDIDKSLKKFKQGSSTLFIPFEFENVNNNLGCPTKSIHFIKPYVFDKNKSFSVFDEINNELRKDENLERMENSKSIIKDKDSETFGVSDSPLSQEPLLSSKKRKTSEETSDITDLEENVNLLAENKIFDGFGAGNDENAEGDDCEAIETVDLSSFELSPPPLDQEISLISRTNVLQELLLTVNFEEHFKISCVNGFITAIGVQYTHPLLTTNATFTEFVDTNPIMKAIAESCGCSYLAWNQPTLNELSFNKYLKAYNMMSNYLKTKYFGDDNIWVCAGLVMLCISSKCLFYGTTKHTAMNLKLGYQIIKNILNQKLIVNQNYQQLQRPSDINYFDNNSTPSSILSIDIENSLINYERESHEDSTRRFERVFVEAFIYNFSVTTLVCSRDADLPNPFVVFRELRNILKSPLFLCDVPWMNNPVLGAAFDSYELAAKASYLIRHLEDKRTFKAAKSLYEISKYYSVPMVPNELRADPLKYRNLRDSILIADVILGCTKILLLKVIDNSIRETHKWIQNEVQLIIKKLEQVTQFSHCKVIVTWALFISGLSCINDEQRMIIIKNVSEVGEITHGCYAFSVLSALNIAWGRDTTHYLCGKGLDILLDGHFLSDISL